MIYIYQYEHVVCMFLYIYMTWHRLTRAGGDCWVESGKLVMELLSPDSQVIFRLETLVAVFQNFQIEPIFEGQSRSGSCVA